jgi:anti-sigma regulatory factor (Ser/Thr protein kinase)
LPLSFTASRPDDIVVLRRSLEAALGEAGVDGEHRDDVVVMTCELVANALIHAQAPARICVELAGRAVHVTVSDHDHAPPILLEQEPTRVGGNGMRIVDALADDWGVVTHVGDGKDVWFERRW